MSPDREEAAIGATPEVVVAEMSDVTGRLGDRLWMVAPMTAGMVTPDAEIDLAAEARLSPTVPVTPRE